MDNLEQIIFNSLSPLLKNVILWKRYVDDIFCIWNGTERQLNSFLTLLNSFNKQIQFTIEIGTNCSLYFLDLNISLINNKFNYNIYRKPTFTDTVIHNSSNHPPSHKHSAFHSMVHRLITILLSDINFAKELSTIKYIASNNGYDSSLIDNILTKKNTTSFHKQIFVQQYNHLYSN